MMHFHIKEIFYISNILTSTRILLTLPIAFLIRENTDQGNYFLVLIALVAVLTDYFDGYFSRRLDQESDIGKLLDPLADKVMIITTMAFLVYYRDFPLSLIVVHFLRDMMIILVSPVIIKKTGNIVRANFWGKLNTFIVSLTIVFFLLDINNAFFTVFFWCNYVTIFISSLTYYLFAESVLVQKNRKKYVARAGAIIIAFGGIYLGMQISFSTPGHTHKVDIEPDVRRKLVEKYAPNLYMHKEEKYRPMNVDCVLKESLLLKNVRLLFFNPIISSEPDTNTLAQYSNPGYYLQYDRQLFDSIHKKYKNVAENCTTTVYGTAFKLEYRDRTTFIIQYWFLFWASSGFMPRVTWHEMDWEMVMFEVDENAQLLRAGYSQNYYGRVMGPGQIQYTDDHPDVFISLNDHNMYAREGVYRSYLDKNMRFQFGKNICSAGVHIPYHRYQLKVIDRHTPWVTFQGYWGRPVTTWLQGPRYRNPKNKKLAMWQNPVGWFIKYQE